jgi:hypothetical protein
MLRRKVLQTVKRAFMLTAGFACIFPATAWSKSNPGPALIRAIRDGQSKKADELIKNNKGINTQDEYGWTPLMYAIFRGDSELIENLLSHGADANLQDQDGITPLIAAIMRTPQPFMLQYMPEDERSVKDIPIILIEKGADPNRADSEGNTPLIYAVIGNHDQIIEALIKKGVDPNRPDRYGRTALFFNTNPDRAAEWAPADGVLSSGYRMRRDQSMESYYSPEYAAKVAEARAQANVILKQIKARITELLKNAGATAPDPLKIQVTGNHIDSPPQRLGTGMEEPLTRIVMQYIRMNQKNARYIILVRITPEGTVKKAIVLRGLDGFSDALQNEALKLKYKPAIKDGRPVEIWDYAEGFVGMR